MIGTLVSACPAIKYGFLYTKNLERQKFLALEKSNDNYDAKTSLGPIRDDFYNLVIFSDASLIDWDVSSNGIRSHGWWDSEEKKEHINYLELKAAFYGLKCFTNGSGVSGEKFGYLRRISSLVIIASPRFLSEDTEWEISDFSFSKIKSTFGKFDIDLFATINNTKCSVCFSWCPDPEAEPVDAFTVQWTYLNLYSFPPFALILRVLRKIYNDKAEGVVVVPYWPSKPETPGNFYMS